MKPGVYFNPNNLKMCELINFSHNDFVIAFHDSFSGLVTVQYINSNLFLKSPYKYLGSV